MSGRLKRKAVGNNERVAPSKKYKAYTKDDLTNALDLVWSHTQRLRTQSDGMWTKDMRPFVQKAAKKVPERTLKDHFLRRLADSSSGVEDHAEKKKRADARGKLKATEMRLLYDWIDYMRRKYLPPTRLELRYQVNQAINKQKLNFPEYLGQYKFISIH